MDTARAGTGQQRLVLALRYLDCLETTEVAYVMGIREAEAALLHVSAMEHLKLQIEATSN